MPDLDNWLKPLLDSMVGPDRLLVDDSLVRHIGITWHEGVVAESTIQFELLFDAEHRLPKNGLRYVQFERGLCFPLPLNEVGLAANAEAVEVLCQFARSTMSAIDKLAALDVHSVNTYPLLTSEPGWSLRGDLRGRTPSTSWVELARANVAGSAGTRCYPSQVGGSRGHAVSGSASGRTPGGRTPKCTLLPLPERGM